MSEPVLELTTRISAPRDVVWRFLVDPERFDAWMGAAQGSASLEPRVGGALRVDFPEFSQVVAGEVLAMEEPTLFAFTWGYEGGGSDVPAGSSRVELRLEEDAAGSVLELRQTGLPDEAAVQRHRGGFRLYASVLASAAAGEALGGAVEPAVEGWFAAWAETEPAKRRAQLESCCSDHVEFRDEYASLRGRADLDGHVATSQAMTVGRGVRLRRGASVVRCHDLVLFDWEAIVGSDTVVASGRNAGRLGPDGRFTSVHGFRDETPPPEA